MPLPPHPGTSRIHASRMKKMRRTRTKPENIVAEIFRENGLFMRRNVKSLSGTPDLAIKKYRIAVFVHGCFWHFHVGCPKARLPNTNKWWWKEKLEQNRTRDQRKERELKDQGFRVLVIWECESTNMEKLRRRIGAFTRSIDIS